MGNFKKSLKYESDFSLEFYNVLVIANAIQM